MYRRGSIKALCCLMLAGILLGHLSPVQARSPQQEQSEQPQASKQEHQLSASEAAVLAKAEHGGKVLKVTRKGNKYRVKLLQESGRVITVTIKG